jgi:hypothetical protein
MLNRSKIVINANSFYSRSHIHVVQQHRIAVPKSYLDDRGQLLAADVQHKARRTAPFPNGDVRPRLGPRERRSDPQEEGICELGNAASIGGVTPGHERSGKVHTQIVGSPAVLPAQQRWLS